MSFPAVGACPCKEFGREQESLRLFQAVVTPTPFDPPTFLIRYFVAWIQMNSRSSSTGIANGKEGILAHKVQG
jgi:hypothetical protein